MSSVYTYRDGKVTTWTNSIYKERAEVIPNNNRGRPLPAVEKKIENEKSKSHATSIQDVMKNVVVYVEVRSGEDNRSEGVRKVIETLGARINLSILK